MKYLIISGNPKNDGMCNLIFEQVKKGAIDAGADVKVLTVENLNRCAVCGDGWGICREENRCAFGNDGFDEAQQIVKDADKICVITPVYWNEFAEGLKCFLDRLRRCEFGESGALSGKQILMIASAGGTGNGLLSCFEQMERFCRHMNAVIFDYIGVNRWNNDYKRKAAYDAAYAMAEGREADKQIDPALPEIKRLK